MARVAATIAAERIDAVRPLGDRRRTIPGSKRRKPVIAPELASVDRWIHAWSGHIRNGPRGCCVKSGDRRARPEPPRLQDAPSHAWFIGYAPYGGKRPLAFAVLIENGQYGGTAAAPLAADLMTAAKELGLFERVE